MNLNELLSESVYFGVALSLVCYWAAEKMKKKWDKPIMNPLLISLVMIIVLLMVFRIDFETYNHGAKYITYFLTPVTVCLAIPLYRKLQVLKDNVWAVAAGILAGCLSQMAAVLMLSFLLHMDKVLILSVLPKSVTTSIALGVCAEIGGISGVTVIGVSIAGLTGAIIGPTILKLTGIKEPVAQGLAMGAASHAIGTTKAVEIGEVEGAMSSLAIVVNGILTVIMAPLMVQLFM